MVQIYRSVKDHFHCLCNDIANNEAGNDIVLQLNTYDEIDLAGIALQYNETIQSICILTSPNFTRLSDNIFQFVKTSPSLRQIDLSGTSLDFYSEFYAAIQENPRIRSLDCVLDPSTCRALVKLLKSTSRSSSSSSSSSLRRLRLFCMGRSYFPFSTAVRRELVSTLGASTCKLNELILVNCDSSSHTRPNVMDLILDGLPAHHSIKTLQVIGGGGGNSSQTITLATQRLLERTRSLETLRLDALSMDASWAQVLETLQTSNQTVHTLDVRFDAVSSEENVGVLLDLVRTTKTLKNLSVGLPDDLDMHGLAVQGCFWRRFADAMVENGGSITNLGLLNQWCRSWIPTSVLVDLIQRCPWLLRLTVDVQNREAFAVISEALGSHPALEQVTLRARGQERIQDVSVLTRALSRPGGSCVRSLVLAGQFDLRGQCGGGGGARNLADFLQSGSCHLTKLEIKVPMLTDAEGLDCVIQAMKSNKTLESLIILELNPYSGSSFASFKRNGLDSVVHAARINAWKSSLEVNSTLTHVELPFLSRHLARSIQFYCSRNKFRNLITMPTSSSSILPHGLSTILQDPSKSGGSVLYSLLTEGRLEPFAGRSEMGQE